MKTSTSDYVQLTEVHPPWVVLIHWVTVALVLLAAASVLSREFFSDKDIRNALLIVHRGAGLMVLVVTILRISISPWTMVKEENDQTPKLLRMAASFSHLVLYTALVANPMLGWALTSARGQVAYFLGVVTLPALVSKDRDFADSLQSIHTAVAIALLIIVLLHSVAALWHHFVRGDAVLRRMLAVRRSANESKSGAAPSSPKNTKHF
jgi:cytochrome b561